MKGPHSAPTRGRPVLRVLPGGVPAAGRPDGRTLLLDVYTISVEDGSVIAQHPHTNGWVISPLREIRG